MGTVKPQPKKFLRRYPVGSEVMAETSPITRDEMRTMFGDTIPMEAVSLLWDSPGEMTVGQIRARLREIAATPKPAPLLERLRSFARMTENREAVLINEATDEIEGLCGLVSEVLAKAPGDDANRFMLLPHALAEAGWFKRANSKLLNIQQPIGGGE
jgi:hypothetical protein